MSRPPDQCRDNLGIINNGITSVDIDVDGNKYTISSGGMTCLNAGEVVKIASDGTYCVMLVYPFIRLIWYRYMSKDDSFVATNLVRHIARYHITLTHLPCWVAERAGVDAGGPLDGTVSLINNINTRMIRYVDDTQLTLGYEGPNEYATSTHDTDIPFAITIFQVMTSVITVTGRSSDHSFIASYLITLDVSTGYTYELISSYTTPDLILYPQVHEINTFSVGTSVSTEWRIQVTCIY